MSRPVRRSETPAPTPEVSWDDVERAWIARIAAGDEAAFDQLFEAYYAPLCEFVYSYVRSHATAEELVQTVFLRLWEKHSNCGGVASLRAYLFTACRNQALDHLKHERIVQHTAEQAVATQPIPGLGSAPAGADEAVQAAELADAIRRAVETLPERCRLVVQLRWQHQLTNVEIARVLGISVKGVEGHLTRAIASLRQQLAAFRP